MFSRFRRESRSESGEDLARDTLSAFEEVGRTTDSDDAGTTTVASTLPGEPSAGACPEVCEPDEAGRPALPGEEGAEAGVLPSGLPAANVGDEARAGVASHVEGVQADLPAMPTGRQAEEAAEAPPDEAASRAIDGRPRLMAARRGRGRSLTAPQSAGRPPEITAEQRLLLLDTWRRSGLPAKDFAALVGVSKYTLHGWKKRFDDFGPAGLADQPRRGNQGSRLPEVTKRTILMLKEGHPQWGCQRISDMLARGPALPASASAVARVLHEAGYELVEEATRSHPDKVHRFERAKANQLWQTDLFTFVLKRQNRRVYLVAFLDDYSRFVVSYGLHASQSTALVLEVLEAGIANYGPPSEILTDNGPQYVTWRGKSQFTRRLEKRGIQQIVAKPKCPQTLGKIERFWGTLWRECLETAVFLDLADARTRIGLFLDYYNFQRPHQGIDGLVPADRFFGAAPEVLKTLRERVAANALELARLGVPKQPFYLTGQVDGQPFSVHRAGDRVVLRRGNDQSEEIELAGAGPAGQAVPTGRQETGATSNQSSGRCILPQAICPDGSPPAPCGEPANGPPLAPGQSALDGVDLDDRSGVDERVDEADDGGWSGGSTP